MKTRILTILLGACLMTSVSAQAPSRYRAFFPPTNDPELLKFLQDPKVRWYDVESKPPIFQHQGRFHSIYEDIGPQGPRFSNGNGEWPWAHPSTPTPDGRTKNVIGVRIAGVSRGRVNFPQYEITRTYAPDGVKVSVEQAGVHPGVGWSFATGTDIVELVTNRIGQGDYTFKAHRMTLTEDNEWLFRVYRPFTSAEAYEQATGTKPVYVGVQRMRSSHFVTAFDEQREVLKVPRIDPELARKLLLTTPFQLATDDNFIPTTEHTDQIYPQNYLGAFIGNAADQDSCRKCHLQVAESVRRFDFGEWYGQVRGGGKDKHGVGVFSWYPE